MDKKRGASMKKKIIILSSCAIFLLSGSVLANSTSKVGKKITAEAPVYLDGQLISDAIITEGSSYSPVRAIAEALGLDVKYETSKEGSVIKLTSPGTKETTNEMIWKKADIEAKIITANLEIQQANEAINHSIEKLKTEKNEEMISFYENRIVESQEKIIKSQQDIITYTNELLELESSN
ncbi:copper amine oxidase N-terminal domain-containing protein [Paenibacillus endoradicis]|uniref:copper amine oxidase N-terminal domain-containing protein n=1 Tax=Paenibacillus endoradicis TaxID=2972487 RepID=UPI0021593387|nr:copper amine oxidase N-terminal domain-containing protein [Paenibacillus endoradicis]MCR8656924.1 copper amine oxidase N-terminal domain-containing protein [Paenibacillus endoradicis]